MRPTDVRYQKTHEWVRAEKDTAVIGITDFAVEHLSDLVHIEIPDLGVDILAGEAFGEIESVKAVSDLIAPVSGEVIDRNEDLIADLEPLKNDPFGKGWILKVRLEKPAELERLLTAEAYAKEVERQSAEEH